LDLTDIFLAATFAFSRFSASITPILLYDFKKGFPKILKSTLLSSKAFSTPSIE
jgi:hypothetical protein